MSLLDALRAGVRAANSVTRNGLQGTIGYYQYISEDVNGVRTYNPPITSPAVPLQVIIDQTITKYLNSEGELTTTSGQVIFLDIVALLAATNNKGVNTEDLIFLPDGTHQPIKKVSGFMDSITGVAVATQAYLG